MTPRFSAVRTRGIPRHIRRRVHALYALAAALCVGPVMLASFLLLNLLGAI
jgi:hypothetical protein